MALIKIFYDGLDKQSSLIKSYTQELSSLITQTQTLTGQIGETWKGNAAVSYNTMLQTYIKEAQKMIEILQTFGKFADGTTQQFRQIDHDCATRIRSSF